MSSSTTSVSGSSGDNLDKNDRISGNESKPKIKVKQKTTNKNEFKEIVMQKRMASLNASAMLAATYEVERHFDRCDSYYNGHLSDSASDSSSGPSKKMEQHIKAEIEEPKETRPVSTNVVIVQDTDVTITGVYVNSTLGSSQEAYCKMQYRVQSSVTEERLVRPTGCQDPPKSYTPLSALSCMLPPGSSETIGSPDILPSAPLSSASVHHQQQQQFSHHSPHKISPSLQHQPIQQPHQQQQQHQQHHHHHHHLQNQQQQQQLHSTHTMPTALHHKTSPDCDSPPFRYQSVYEYQTPIIVPPQQPATVAPPSTLQPLPQPPPIIQSSSAFCAIPPSHHHHDSAATGYYQPAGPLISSHLVQQSQQGSTKSIPASLDSDTVQLQQPPPSTSAAESSDSEVLITGGDLTTPRPHTFRYAPQAPPTGPYSRPIHQMHCPTYPPATSYYASYSQHPQDMCYSPPYQPPPYYPSKIYPATYRRYVTTGSYYQPTPSDMYDPPPPPPTSSTMAQPPQSQPPPPTGTQIVPAQGPNGPQHIDHHYSPYYTTGYSPGGGQCYSRSIQPPYMDAPPYPSSCPCPMQSCPKNVHTGPLIGNSKSSKGPVQSSHITSMTVSCSAGGLNATSVASTATVAGSATVDTMALMQPANMLLPSKVTCKTEDHQHHHHHNHHHSPLKVIKPEINDGHLYIHPSTITAARVSGGTGPPEADVPNLIIDRTRDKPYEQIIHAPPQHPPAFTLNTKILEPESPISPARGSIGLPQMPPTGLDSAAQPMPMEMPTHITRRARVGKTMAREMMMMPHSYPHQHHHHHQQQHNNHNNHHHHLYHSQNQYGNINNHDDQRTAITATLDHMCDQTDLMIDIKPTVELIKKEHVKIEKQDDDVVFLEKCDLTANSNNLMTSTTTTITTKPLDDRIDLCDEKWPSSECITVETSNNNKRKFCESEIISIDDSIEDYCLPVPSGKKKRILELNRNVCKKSPPNSYKNLIKQSEPKTYLNSTINRRTPIRSRFRVIRNSSRYANQPRKIIINRKHKKVVITSSKKVKRKLSRNKLRMISDGNSIIGTSSPITIIVKEENCDDVNSVEDDASTIIVVNDETSVQKTDEKKQTENVIVTNPDLVIKQSNFNQTSCIDDHSSDVDKLMCETKTIKETSMDTKSQKLTIQKSSKKDPSLILSSTPSNGCLELNETNCFKEQSDVVSRIVKVQELKTVTFSNKQDIQTSIATKIVPNPNSRDRGKKSNKKRTKSKRTRKAQPASLNKILMKNVDDNDNNDNVVATTTLLDNDSINNNSSILDNKNYQSANQIAKTIVNSNSAAPTNSIAVPNAIKPKPKARSSKFSNKKRHQHNQQQHHRVRRRCEVPAEIIVPRKSNAPPRWSNGWNWIGQSFQEKVFLNSDDAQVVRTRYSAMEHDSGDIIQPGDCVLLKAGSKKNELPYVAKVASLWENPEDGEMMMSLLWYYRPEHTEQGRQPTDCSDEVFASRHQDHNSVACIEDKCYVLTFNEYCRYRKTIKAIEEGIDEPLPVGPFHCSTYSAREVPNNANSELIFFCRRVYEFRLKRLIKNPT